MKFALQYLLTLIMQAMSYSMRVFLQESFFHKDHVVHEIISGNPCFSSSSKKITYVAILVA